MSRPALASWRRAVALLACAVTALALLLPIPVLAGWVEAAGLGALLERLLRDDGVSSGPVPVDKLVHVVLFAALTAIVAWSSPRRIALTPLWPSALFVLLYSWALEVLQGLLGVGAAELADALGNALGIALAWAGLTLLRRLSAPPAVGSEVVG